MSERLTTASDGLTKLFQEIRDKEHLTDLSVQYQKFAEWLRIEYMLRRPLSVVMILIAVRVAATLYHLFLAEDNSPELFAQGKRIHSLIPYTVIKNVIRVANPALVMTGILDLFLAQPFGSRSLLQRIFGMTLNDGIKSFQKAIDGLVVKIDDPVLCAKLKRFTDADEETKNAIRAEAAADNMDLIVSILRTDMISPDLKPDQVGRIFNAYVAWNNVVENVSSKRLIIRVDTEPC
jgi:hypothetical protein